MFESRNQEESAMNTLRLRLVAIAAIVALSVGFLAAMPVARAQDSTPGNEFPVNIRFLNAMTAVDKIDVYINSDEKEQRVVEGLEYGVVSDAYEGTAPVTAVVIKQNVNNGFDQYLYQVVVPTEAGQDYLVVVSDLLLIPTEMDLTSTGADQARVRAINAAAQSPALDFYVTRASEETVAGDLTPVVTDIRFGEATDAGERPAGTYDITAKATGTDEVAVESAGVAVDAGQSYTFVVLGSPGSTDTPLTILPVSQAVVS
jgi:hypothetical protein